MIETGPYPILEDNDTVAEVKDYSEKMAAAVAILDGKVKSVALKASAVNGSVQMNATAQRVPYVLAPNGAGGTPPPNGDFADGITLLPNGEAQIITAGTYAVTAAVGAMGVVEGAGLKVFLRKNGNPVQATEVRMSGGIWVDKAIHLDAVKLAAAPAICRDARPTGARTSSATSRRGRRRSRRPRRRAACNGSARRRSSCRAPASRSGTPRGRSL